ADLAAQTRRAQDVDLARWGRYLDAAGVRAGEARWAAEPAAWGGVSWGLVEGFLRWQERAGYSLASIARALSTVRAYCTHAARAGILAPEALALIQTVKAPAPRSKAGRNRDAQRETTRRGAKKAAPTRLSLAQARGLRRAHPDTPQGRRDALLMCLLLDHGLRVSELADLQVADLDLGQGMLRFYRRKVDATQTHRLTGDTLRAARRYVEAGDAPEAGQLLRTTERPRSPQLGAGISIQGLRDRVRILGARAGVAGLSPHDCRHFWATRAAHAGTDPLALQEAGGWSSLAMPRRYIAAAAIANDRVRLGADEDDLGQAEPA
ncbi:MAG: site-specific integrase, partial [Oscillochloris sp.]|nr:site-specific integrase [Oscillochloris sp.]